MIAESDQLGPLLVVFRRNTITTIKMIRSTKRRNSYAIALVRRNAEVPLIKSNIGQPSNGFDNIALVAMDSRERRTSGHTKAEPCISRIIAETDAEVDLTDALERLREPVVLKDYERAALEIRDQIAAFAHIITDNAHPELLRMFRAAADSRGFLWKTVAEYVATVIQAGATHTTKRGPNNAPATPS